MCVSLCVYNLHTIKLLKKFGSQGLYYTGSEN